MKCIGCWNYKKCPNKDKVDLVACFKKSETICHYCKKENRCDRACRVMVICSDFEKEEQA